MTEFFNRVMFRSTTDGTDDFIVGSAITGYRTPATASVPDETPVSYTAESDDKTEWETGGGKYDVGTTTLRRTTIRESSNSNNKVNFATEPKVWFDFHAQDASREKLTADRTYYVRSDGNDNNDGLTDTSAGAFLTPQKAYDVVKTLDFSGFDVRIQLQDTTWTGTNIIHIDSPWIGGGTLTIDAAGGTLDATQRCVLVETGCVLPGSVTLQNMTMTSDVACITHNGSGSVFFGNSLDNGDGGIIFGSAVAHIQATGAGTYVQDNDYYEITAGAAIHVSLNNYASVVLFWGFEVTAARNFTTAFISANSFALMDWAQEAFTGAGSVTGKRFSVTRNALFRANGAGHAGVFGNSAGTVADGGVFQP